MNKAIGKRLLAAFCVPAIVLTLFVTGLFGATAMTLTEIESLGGGVITTPPTAVTTVGDLAYTLMLPAPNADGSVGDYTDNKGELDQRTAAEGHEMWWIQAFSGLEHGTRVLAPQDFSGYDYFAFEIFIENKAAVLSTGGNNSVINVNFTSGIGGSAEKDSGIAGRVLIRDLTDGWNRVRILIGVDNSPILHTTEFPVNWGSVKNIVFKANDELSGGTGSAWRLGNSYLVKDNSGIADVPALKADGEHNGKIYQNLIEAPSMDGRVKDHRDILLPPGDALKSRVPRDNHELWWIQCFANDGGFNADWTQVPQDLTGWENLEVEMFVGNVNAILANEANAILNVNFATGNSTADKDNKVSQVTIPVNTLQDGWNTLNISFASSHIAGEDSNPVDWDNVRSISFKMSDMMSGTGSYLRLGNVYLTKEAPAPSYTQLPDDSPILKPVAAAIRSELLDGKHALRFLFNMDKEAEALVNDGWTYQSRGILTMLNSKVGLITGGTTLEDKMLLENVASGVMNNVAGTNTYLYYTPNTKQDYTLLITGIPAGNLKTEINARGYVIFTKGSETRVLYTKVLTDSVFNVYKRMDPADRLLLSSDVRSDLDPLLP